MLNFRRVKLVVCLWAKFEHPVPEKKSRLHYYYSAYCSLEKTLRKFFLIFGWAPERHKDLTCLIDILQNFRRVKLVVCLWAKFEHPMPKKNPVCTTFIQRIEAP
jgi:hypothetical protein